MDLLELNILKKIEPVYKKSFVITFLIAIIVYFTMISNLFWGHHDWESIQKSVNALEYLYIGRFSVTWLQSLFGFKLIPYINCILFIVLSIISTLLTSYYWKIEKNSKILILFSSFWVLSLASLAVMYYRFIAVDLVFGFLSVVLSILLSLKANNFDIKKRILILFLSYILLFVFVFGAYSPLINSVLVLLGGRFLIDLKISNFKLNTIQNFLVEHKYFFLVLFLAVISNFLSIYIINLLGYLSPDEYNIALIKYSDIHIQLLSLVRHSFEALFYPFPFVSIYVKVLEFLIVLISIGYYIYSIFKTSDYKLINKLFYSIFIIFLFYVILLFGLFSYFISNGLTDLELRVDHFGYEIFYLFCISVVLQMKNFKFLHNTVIVVLFLLLWNFSINNMCAQKNLLLSFDLERDFQNRLLNRIEENENFSYDKKYIFFEVGHYYPFKKKLYNSNSYKLVNYEFALVDNVFSEYMHDYLLFLSQKDFIDKKVSDSLYNNYDNNLDLYENSEYLKEIHFDELYDFVMNKAKVWPDKNSVYISDNCIIVIFDEYRLDYLREKIKNVKF